MVHAHAGALLTGYGTTSLLFAGLRDPARILADQNLRERLTDAGPLAGERARAVRRERDSGAARVLTPRWQR
jgi:hypothetical protein